MYTDYNTHSNDRVWFAMSAPFGRELEAKRLLDKRKIENFIPMHYDVVVKRTGEKKRELVPAIRNFIFVRTTRPVIQETKREIRILQYYTRPENGKNIPVIIPETQMSRFVAVSETHDEKLVYMKPEEVDLRKGRRVRIHGGAFDGVEGVFVKVRGIRNRRVVVLVEGIAAVVMAEIKPDLIEALPQEENGKTLKLCL
ncbi:MAG: UpxY family transcription antiterminator [Tannerellaceae bacterium]|jgi:transcription antitermination factor NusG|nr:UpxY family transcription antiterminator [Tannerellaceae bacterium]